MHIKRLTQLIVAGTSISTITLGYFLFSRRNKLRESSMAEHVSEIADWADQKGRSVVAKSVDQMQQLQHNMRERAHYHLPDLYKATEQISLSH